MFNEFLITTVTITPVPRTITRISNAIQMRIQILINVLLNLIKVIGLYFCCHGNKHKAKITNDK